MNFKKQLTGERINLFEKHLTNDVKTFNLVFDDFPISLPDDTEIEIGEIKRTNCYEITTNSGEKFDHYFERRKLDESIIDDDFSNDDDF